jgi:hypothetical protein
MPVPLLAIAAGASALSTLPNWYQSWKQSERADELAKGLKRPDFEIPQSELESLQSANAQAGMTRLPGQSAIEGRLDQNTSNLVSDIERMGTGGPNDINTASRAYGMQQEGENKLGVDASNMFLRNQDILRSELDENAEWQNKKWDWDKKQPYENTANAIGALRESSARNFDTAWKDLTGGVSNLAMGEYLRGAGGLDLGGGKTIDPNSASNPAFTMLMNPNQKGPTQDLIGAGSLVNDQAFKIEKRPILDSFNFGGYNPYKPTYTSK